MEGGRVQVRRVEELNDGKVDATLRRSLAKWLVRSRATSSTRRRQPARFRISAASDGHARANSPVTGSRELFSLL